MNDRVALLSAIHAHPRELTPRVQLIDWAEENSELVRASIDAVIKQVPRLTAFGIGVSQVHRRPGEPRETHDQWQVRFNSERECLLKSVEAFAASLGWLATRGRRATVDRNRDSYGYKHDVERDLRDLGHPVYVANGVFIAAAIDSGFAWKLIDHGLSPNVMFGISRRAPAFDH